MIKLLARSNDKRFIVEISENDLSVLTGYRDFPESNILEIRNIWEKVCTLENLKDKIVQCKKELEKAKDQVNATLRFFD